MKATVRIGEHIQFTAEFPHDVCIEEEFVFNGDRLVIVDIFLENLSVTSDNPVKFQHIVVCESAETGE